MPEIEPVDVSEIEKPEFIGTVIIDASSDDMQTFLDTGAFPQKNNSTEDSSSRRRIDEPVRRRDAAPESRVSRRRV